MSEPQNQQDEIINKIADVSSEITEQVEQSEDHAIFVLGVKHEYEEDRDESTFHTYINATGFYDILAEGLFQELSDQVSNGQMNLFLMLRDVVRSLEEEFSIDPDDDLSELGPDEVYH